MKNSHNKCSTPNSPTFEGVLESFLLELRDSSRNPAIGDYENRYPQFAERIANHFPGVIIAEELRGHNKPAEVDLELPYTIGKFRLTDKIGRGGTATVFSASHKDLEMEFAVKLVECDKTSDRQLARFKREARAISRLHHSGIPSICDFGHHEGFVYIAMSKVDGITFRQLFSDPTSINGVNAGVENILGNWNLLAILFREVAKILTYIHENQLVHRDIKPSNLMIDKKSNVWITDFGLVKQLAIENSTHSSTDVVGTASYVAPECFNGIVTPQSDVYSLGVTLFELATGVSAASVLAKQLDSSPAEGLPPTIEVNADVPKQLAKIIDRACHPKPNLRFADAETVARELQAFALSKNKLSGLFSRFVNLKRD